MSLKLSSNALMPVELSVAPAVADRHTIICAILKCNNGFSFVQCDCLLCCPCFYIRKGMETTILSDFKVQYYVSYGGVES